MESLMKLQEEGFYFLLLLWFILFSLQEIHIIAKSSCNIRSN